MQILHGEIVVQKYFSNGVWAGRLAVGIVELAIVGGATPVRARRSWCLPLAP